MMQLGLGGRVNKIDCRLRTVYVHPELPVMFHTKQNSTAIANG